MEFIFFATIFLYAFIVGSLTDFVDYDFFARLIVGKTFFQTGEILKYDFQSYSHTHPWYDHEWGASLAFYFIQDHFGSLGLQIFKAICILITIFFFIQIIKLRRKTLTPEKQYPIFNFLFFFIMFQPLQQFIFSLRCHHFTFIFFSIWLYVLEKARLEKNYRILWTLPLLMIIWSNVHGGCFMGLGLLGLYIIGEFLGKKPFLPYVYTFLASFGVMIINPYGIDYVKFLVKATTMTRGNILEWQPTFGKYFIFKLIKYKIVSLGFVGLTVYNFIKTLKLTEGEKFKDKFIKIWNKIDKTKAIVLLAMFLLSIKSMRFITYFIFVLIPFCYDDFYSVFSKQMKPKINMIKEFVIFLFFLVLFVLNAVISDFKYSNFHTIFPLTEVQYLIDNNIKGNVMVPFEIGSYTAYKLYPDNYILHDGRFEEVYNVELNDIYAKTITLGAVGWKEMLDSIHHDIIITYKQSTLFENLKKHPDYYEILESGTFGMFINKNHEKAKITNPVIPTDNPEFYKESLWDTNINWVKE